ncbi:hypothetical protein CCACVL1_01466, partial [Corchorus capsularis]
PSFTKAREARQQTPKLRVCECAVPSSLTDYLSSSPGDGEQRVPDKSE